MTPQKATQKKTTRKKPAEKKPKAARRTPRRSGPKIRPAGFLVAPGASADRDNRTLVALDEGLDLPVERITIRSRAVRKVHDQLRSDMEAFADRLGADPAELIIGGRSFGGRMCSMLAASGEPVAGLVLLSYPLHPPGKPDTLRTDHFGDIDVPVLFVSGTSDPFASPDELEEHAALIPGPVTFEWLEGEPHAPRDDAAVVAAVQRWVSGGAAPRARPRG
jgi:predicted alpha/beta-hydrolase family hydrolase